MANLRTIGAALQARGHRVVAAVRDAALAARVFDTIPFVAAPATHALPADPVVEGCTFADLMHNNGCASDAELDSLVRAWRALFDLVRPDVVVMEFSPIALLALQGYPARRVVVGTGYYCPPDVSPLPDLRDGRASYPERMIATERRVLDRLNRVLEGHGEPPLERVGALYTRLETNLLATFPELDHYGHRRQLDYCGNIARLPGAAPRWPPGEGPRVFAYLRPYPTLRGVLDELRRRGNPALVYLTGMDVGALQRSAPAHLRFERAPLDLERVAAECDAAVLYAPHDSTAALLRAGKPVLQLPHHLEQRIMARSTERLGAGVAVYEPDRNRIQAGLEAVVEERAYADAARAFASRYAGCDMGEQVDAIADQVEALCRVD